MTSASVSATAATSYAEGASPGAGACFWYLARKRNACGVGPWGTRSDGVPRAVPSCP